jgi:hypothetical protein
VFILKGVKVLCFDTLLQVLILKIVRGDFKRIFQMLIQNDLARGGSACEQE